ncbi:MAG TPA: SDR family NAD(P)-dependent oxidoreductase [Chloroflexia bacterium]|nr:SDR family NAD(P)-dependent oxidoreductase [Chloroflexia bacterium]
MHGRVVIITGASSGIGWAVARRAAQQGYQVVLAARRVARLRELAHRITGAGGQALVVPTDVAVLDDQRRLIDSTIQAFGRLDVLFNNAGLPLPGLFHESSPEELRRQWDVNVTAVATLTRLALPYLESQHGSVVNVGSALTRIAMPGIGNYSPNKIAVTALSDALRRELAPYGVAVCLVEPGPVATEFHAKARRRQILPALFVLTPAAVARPIVRLFDHPRRRIVIPAYLAPILAGLELAGRLIPPLADRLAATHARRGQV